MKKYFRFFSKYKRALILAPFTSPTPLPVNSLVLLASDAAVGENSVMDNQVMERTYKSSTFFLAQGVLRKNFSEELMLGLLIKQLILIIFPRSSQPKWCTSSLRMVSSVLPCSGSLDAMYYIFMAKIAIPPV